MSGDIRVGVLSDGVAEMRSQLEKMIDAVRADVEPTIRDMAKSHPEAGADDLDEMIKINVAANFLRICNEVALKKSIPFTSEVPAQIAVRVAAHLLSCVPPDEMQSVCVMVACALPEQLALLHENGGAMTSEWGTMQ